MTDFSARYFMIGPHEYAVHLTALTLGDYKQRGTARVALWAKVREKFGGDVDDIPRQVRHDFIVWTEQLRGGA